jgi:hypothetical protein
MVAKRYTAGISIIGQLLRYFWTLMRKAIDLTAKTSYLTSRLAIVVT